jgi:hypothetical protein
MTDFERLVKRFGRASKNGVWYAWDFAQDKMRVESEMTPKEKATSDLAHGSRKEANIQ